MVSTAPAPALPDAAAAWAARLALVLVRATMVPCRTGAAASGGSELSAAAAAAAPPLGLAGWAAGTEESTVVGARRTDALADAVGSEPGALPVERGELVDGAESSSVASMCRSRISCSGGIGTRGPAMPEMSRAFSIRMSVRTDLSTSAWTSSGVRSVDCSGASAVADVRVLRRRREMDVLLRARMRAEVDENGLRGRFCIQTKARKVLKTVVKTGDGEGRKGGGGERAEGGKECGGVEGETGGQTLVSSVVSPARPP